MSHVLTCAFCGQKYPPGTPPTQHAALTAHIQECPTHPVRQDLEDLVSLVAKADDAIYRLGSPSVEFQDVGDHLWNKAKELTKKYALPIKWE